MIDFYLKLNTVCDNFALFAAPGRQMPLNCNWLTPPVGQVAKFAFSNVC